MNEVWFLRHGQTDWNLLGKWQGQAPYAPGLNETGFVQARAAARQLSRVRFEAIYSSDLLRARQTAEAVAAVQDLPVILDERLREVNLGVWEGMLSEDVRSGYPNELEERELDPMYARPPQGESLAKVSERVRAALGDILQKQAQAPVLIVSHGLALAALICLAGNIPIADAYNHIPENAVPVQVFIDQTSPSS